MVKKNLKINKLIKLVKNSKKWLKIVKNRKK